MADAFRGVAGVAGNHDLFAGDRPAHCLDGHCLEIDGVGIGGVSGIIGDPRKPNRHIPEQFVAHLAEVVAQQPHLLLLHAAPHGDAECRGDHHIAEALLEFNYDGLIVCGHVHWSARVRQLGSATIRNVHEAMVCVMPASKQ